MFLKLSEHLEKTNPLKRTYKGKVVDNNDPDKLGRVKCHISGLYNGDPANLPWVTPRRSSAIGGKANSGGYGVPEVDSYLEIKFPTEDIYSPFYYGYWEDANTHPTEFDTDYPDTYGWVDSTGTKVIINKKQMSFLFEHTSGIKFAMDKDGNLNIDIPKDVVENITGNQTENVTGDKTVTAENINLESGSDTTINSGGNAEVSATGEASFKGVGGTKVGDPASITEVDGALVNLGGGGLPVARKGDLITGYGFAGAKVVGNIQLGSGKVFSS